VPAEKRAKGCICPHGWKVATIGKKRLYAYIQLRPKKVKGEVLESGSKKGFSRKKKETS